MILCVKSRSITFISVTISNIFPTSPWLSLYSKKLKLPQVTKISLLHKVFISWNRLLWIVLAHEEHVKWSEDIFEWSKVLLTQFCPLKRFLMEWQEACLDLTSCNSKPSLYVSVKCWIIARNYRNLPRLEPLFTIVSAGEKDHLKSDATIQTKHQSGQTLNDWRQGTCF